MRTMLAVVALFGCFSLGCDDDTSSMMMTADLSVAPDLSVKVGPDACLVVAMCAQQCAGAASCIADCTSNGTLAAQMKFAALGQCALDVCTMAGDGGVKPCSGATDSSATCQTCLAAAGQGASCSTQFSACLQDH